MTSLPAVTIVGSINADLVVRVERFPAPGETIHGVDVARFPGGKGANQAYAAARLGAEAGLVAQVGSDEAGAWLRSHLRAGGVDTRFIHVDEAATTGLAVITVDASGQNAIVLVSGANGTFTPERLARHVPSWIGPRVVLLQLEIPLTTVQRAAEAAHAAGALVVLDPAPARDVPDGLLALVDYLTPNESELVALTGGGAPAADLQEVKQRVAVLQARGARRVIVKCGARGAVLAETDVHVWPAHDVPVVDTTAAGDTFNGALAAALADGMSIREACRFANAAAALSVTAPGAQGGMPDRQAVFRLLASGPRRV